jgi:hypothetical protein
MKSTFIKAGLVAVFALVLGTTGYGQISQKYNADIPFDFQVGGRTYHAGTYTIGALSDNSNSGAVTIHDRDGGEKRVIGTALIGAETPNRAGKLVFVKLNGVYALERVQTRTIDMKVRTPRADSQLARNSSEKGEKVSVPLGQ